MSIADELPADALRTIVMTTSFDVRIHVRESFEVPIDMPDAEVAKQVEVRARATVEKSYDLGNHGGHYTATYGEVGLCDVDLGQENACVWAMDATANPIGSGLWQKTGGELDIDLGSPRETTPVAETGAPESRDEK